MDEDFFSEETNDMPEGLARIEALNGALKTATGGEDVDAVLSRARMYYNFLMTNGVKGGNYN